MQANALYSTKRTVRDIHLDLKLVSVKLSGFAFVLPTRSFGFCASGQSRFSTLQHFELLTLKSFFFSAFFLALEPILLYEFVLLSELSFASWCFYSLVVGALRRSAAWAVVEHSQGYWRTR